MDQRSEEEEDEARHRDLVNVDESKCSSLLENLPIGITQTILQNLSFPCLFRCTLLNKSFYKSMSTNMSFAINDPFLFFKLKNSLYYVRLDSTNEISNNKIVCKPIEVNVEFQLSNSYITGSCNGYLCLSTTSSSSSSQSSSSTSPSNPNGQNSTLIFNPLMPRSVKEFSTASMELSWASGFGFNPRTGEHKVVRVYYERDGFSTTQNIRILNARTNHWRTLDAPSEVYLRSRTGNYARGVFSSNEWIYWLGERQPTMTCVIMGLNLNEENFREIPVPGERKRCDHYLIEVRGDLVLVVYNKSDNELQIWDSEDDGENVFSWKRSMFGISDFNKSVIDKLPTDDDRDMFLAGLYRPTLYDVVYLEHDKLLLQFKNGVLCYDLANKRFVEFEVVGLLNLGGDQKEFQMIVFHGSVLDAEKCV